MPAPFQLSIITISDMPKFSSQLAMIYSLILGISPAIFIIIGIFQLYVSG